MEVTLRVTNFIIFWHFQSSTYSCKCFSTFFILLVSLFALSKVSSCPSCGPSLLFSLFLSHPLFSGDRLILLVVIFFPPLSDLTVFLHILHWPDIFPVICFISLSPSSPQWVITGTTAELMAQSQSSFSPLVTTDLHIWSACNESGDFWENTVNWRSFHAHVFASPTFSVYIHTAIPILVWMCTCEHDGMVSAWHFRCASLVCPMLSFSTYLCMCACVFIIRQISSILSPLQSWVASDELQQRSGTKTNIPVTILKTVIPAMLSSQQYDSNYILLHLFLLQQYIEKIWDFRCFLEGGGNCSGSWWQYE